MKLRNINYHTWTRNHQENHPAAWFRQYYPFDLFQRVKFSPELIGQSQVSELKGIKFELLIKSIRMQENGRWNCVLSIQSKHNSPSQQWHNRSWSSDFVFIYSASGDFITVFTKDTDPTKEAIIDFRENRFDKLVEIKSMPVSNILIQSLILDVGEDAFPNGNQDKNQAWLNEGLLPLLEHPGVTPKPCNFFSPLYSCERDLWICYAYNEEKAHRIAIYNGNQCRKLITVFVCPTPTKHHRCRYPHVKVISLNEFCCLSANISSARQNQIRFLQNHMNGLPRERSKITIEQEITNQCTPCEIKMSELKEAFSIMKIIPKTEEQMFYYLSAMNLINAWISAQRNNKSTNNNLFRDMYFFKTYLSNVLELQIKTSNILGKLSIEGGIVMIEIFDYQFSFHAIPKSNLIREFETSPLNARRQWRGVRLQPVAPLILELGRLVCPGGLV